MRVLLLGKQGQVGRELQRTLLTQGTVCSLGREQADLLDLPRLKQILYEQSPELIVNAAAYTAVDQAETYRDVAYTINAEAVGVLADYAKVHGALLVHYSTDYVFDGDKSTGYQEQDKPNPINVYGQSKLAGEDLIGRSGCKALIFRTSWVFSAEGSNFIKTILRLAAERDTIQVVADQQGAPTSAEMIADVTALAISSYRNGILAEGTYHLTAAEMTSWHGLARYVIERARGNGAVFKLAAEQIHAIPTASYPLPAKRPPNSGLDTRVLSRALSLHFPAWTVYVDRTVDQLTRS